MAEQRSGGVGNGLAVFGVVILSSLALVNMAFPLGKKRKKKS